MGTPEQTSQQEAEKYWLECIRKWYPELQSKTYFLPPLHFNRISYRTQVIAEHPVSVPLIPQDSDVRDDRTQARVLQCLRALSDNTQQTDNTQHADKSQQTVSTQTDNYQTDNIQPINNSHQTDNSQQADNSQRTDNSQETGDSQQTYNIQQRDNSRQADKSQQTYNTHTYNIQQIDNSQADNIQPTNNSQQIDDSPQTDNSQQTNNTRTDNSQQTNNIQIDTFQQTNIVHTDNTQQADNTQTDNSQQTENPCDKEVMMVISQLQFGKYLGEPSYAAAVDLLPRPNTLPKRFRKQEKRYDQGDFDVLIIHKELGLLTLEIKSVGENFKQLKMTERKQDDVVMKKVQQAVKQLNKAEVVLKHLTSDMKTNTQITKILVLPNISSRQLLRVINRTPDHGKFVCECLGAKSVVDAMKLCLLKDQLSDNQTPSDINHSSLQALREWWQCVRVSRSGSSLTSSLYEQLVARFCGPATTVEVHCVTAPRLNIRTLGEAVSETGERVARLVLFPQQVDILNQSPPRVFLSGPPGTGKTIVLIMQGLTWIQRGHDVHVVSTRVSGLAVTFVIEYQLQGTAKTSTTKSRVHRHQFHFQLFDEGMKKTAVRCLKSLSEGRQLCVIADEAVRERKLFTEFCDQLINEIPGVHIWGASVHPDVRPLCLDEVKMTTPLRSPPVVVREVMEARQIKRNKNVENYTVSDVPVPTDGPPLMSIKHLNGRSGHTGEWPQDCEECGHQVASVLTKLNVGWTGDSNGPPPLQYRDVLVVCDGYPTDDRLDNNGQVTRRASGLIRGLRDCHVPVRVVEEGDEAAIRDMALGVGDLVTVSHWYYVQGLERKVVVVVRGIGDIERLHFMSRCTSQLVLIDC